MISSFSRISRRAPLVAVLVLVLSGIGLVAPATAAPNRTPGLDEVLNGFVVGALRDGRLASPQEVIDPLVSGDPFYAEPRLTGREKPSMVRFLTNLYGWGTDLFGMQTVDWLAEKLAK
ncbi:hypothetical protein [Gordonia alkanivorans]|uniref:Uncharacterized protein n=1 Tax=Gordonia alkanivorans NBRC 16433 TaxID=1027371 RepID=F9VYU1_9ACTN|nr:hypothetical protein [Gordonia alkanivorans]GAA13780.1 hypothetical protein GOALK_092_00450 [Gordonia alkanivorans NBRC 16433]